MRDGNRINRRTVIANDPLVLTLGQNPFRSLEAFGFTALSLAPFDVETTGLVDDLPVKKLFCFIGTSDLVYRTSGRICDLIYGSNRCIRVTRRIRVFVRACLNLVDIRIEFVLAVMSIELANIVIRLRLKVVDLDTSRRVRILISAHVIIGDITNQPLIELCHTLRSGISGLIDTPARTTKGIARLIDLVPGDHRASSVDRCRPAEVMALHIHRNDGRGGRLLIVGDVAWLPLGTIFSMDWIRAIHHEIFANPHTTIGRDMVVKAALRHHDATNHRSCRIV